MAIDTAARRFGMLDFGLPLQPGIMPPDGALGQSDRQAFLWLYPGISAGSPAILTARPGFLAIAADRAFAAFAPARDYRMIA